MLTIEDIKQVSFRKAGFGGYKPEDVDAFIDQVLITMEQLKKEKSDLVKKMDILATRVEEYRADEDAVRNALLASQRVADSTIKGAKAKAAQILEEADQAITLSQRYYKGCEMTRNRFMLDHSDGVIAYYDGIRTGGTAFTYKAAVKSGRESVNLYK